MRILVLAAFAAAASQPAGGPQRLAVLGGHLLVPATGELRGNAGMTELVIEPGTDSIGPADFILRATEIHARTTGNVVEDARRFIPDRTRVAPGPVVNGIRIAWTTDETKWNGEVPIELVAAVLVHPDGSLQRLTIHIAARLAAKRDAYAARARAMVDGILPGPPLATGPATLELADGIVIDVPKGYVYRREIPMEGQVMIHIDHLRTIGERSEILTIHAGPPGPARPDLPDLFEPKDTVRVPGVLLGQKIQWRSSGSPDGRDLRSSVRGGGRRITVIAYSSDKTSERALRAIAETLRSR